MMLSKRKKKKSDLGTASMQLTEKGDSDWATTSQRLTVKVDTCESLGS